MAEQRDEAYELLVAEQQTEIESLRAQLAEERQQKHEALHREYCRREELERQLAEVSAELEIAKGTAAALEREFDNHTATQAHAARLESAVQPIIDLANAYDEQFGDDDKTPVATAVGVISPDVLRDIRKVAYRSINLDALHEDRARECERLRAIWMHESHSYFTEIFLQEEAAAHRAKKEAV